MASGIAAIEVGSLCLKLCIFELLLDVLLYCYSTGLYMSYDQQVNVLGYGLGECAWDFSQRTVFVVPGILPRQILELLTSMHACLLVVISVEKLYCPMLSSFQN